ncbi:MAG: T9SS type A sorting domain-containing protein [Bacteroidia bacterium]
MQRITLLLILILGLINNGFATNPGWESYSAEQIISTSVHGSTLWILTSDKVIKYNLSTGSKNYFDKNNTGIYFGCYGQIYADRSGRVWTSVCSQMNPVTGQSFVLAMFDGSSWTAYSASDIGSGFNGGIGNFTEDDLGRIFFSTRTGFCSYWNGTFQSIEIPALNLNPPQVRSMALDTAGSVWLATNSGYFYYDGSQFYDFALPGKSTYSSLSGNLGGVNTLAFEQNGTLWLGSTDQADACNGLYKLENGTFTKFDSTNSVLANWSVNQIRIDRNNVKWILNNSRVYWHDNGSFANFPAVDSLSRIFNINIDDYDSKWFCNFSSKFLSFDNHLFKHFDIKSNTLESTITSVAPDTTSGMYIGGMNYGAIPFFDGTHWDTLRLPNHSRSSTSVAMDKNNVLWAVCEGKDVHRYDGNTLTTFDSSNASLGNFDFYRIYIDEGNRPWLHSNYDGILYTFTGINWQRFDLENFLMDPNITISGMGFSPGRITWVSVYQKGLVRIDSTGGMFVYQLPDLLYPNGTAYRMTYSPVYGFMLLLVNGQYHALKTFDGITVTQLDDITSIMNNWSGTNINAFSFTVVDSTIWLEASEGIFRWDGISLTQFTQYNSGFCGYPGNAFESNSHGDIICGGNFLNIYRDQLLTGTSTILPENFSLQVYPNPSHSNLTVKSDEQILEWKIYNVDGKTISSSYSADKQIDIPVDHLNPGIYFILIKTSKTTSVSRFIRE